MNNYSFPELKKRIFNRHCKILSTGSFFPETVVTNDQIIRDYDHKVTDVVIRKTVGVRERRVAEKGYADSDLLVIAAQQCLQKAGIKPEELSKILVTKFLGDRALPMTASFLQRKLNCTHAVQSFDIDGGINSFLQAFDLACCAINSGDKYILIVSGGIINTLVKKTDPRYAFLFGDGAAAILLGPSDELHIESSYFFTNHEFIDHTTGFSHRKRFSSDIHETKNYEILYDLYETGDWKNTCDFIVEACKTTVNKILQDCGIDLNEIDLFLITESNRRQWQTIIDNLNIDTNKTVSVIEKYGNTMSAMLPVLLDEAFKTGRIREGSRIFLLSIGEGISGGGLIYRV